jgi:MFS superfamily sulfate permease-like transporter
MSIIFWILIILVACGIALLFEEVRELLLEGWEYVLEGLQYFISFEWWGDVWEFISEMFTNLDEFSVGGLAFGLCSVIIIVVLRERMLVPFLQYMNPFQRIFWEVATYLCCFILGYLIGKRMFDD